MWVGEKKYWSESKGKSFVQLSFPFNTFFAQDNGPFTQFVLNLSRPELRKKKAQRLQTEVKDHLIKQELLQSSLTCPKLPFE